MRRSLPNILLMAALLSMLPEAVYAAKIVIPANVCVNGTQVMLLEIAHIEGDTEEQARLHGVSLGVAPLLGESYAFSVGMIRMCLRQYGVNPDSVTLDCPPTISVTRASTRVEGTALAAVAEGYLRGTLPKTGNEVSVSATQVPANLQLPVGTLTWNCALNGSTTGSLCNVLVTAKVDGLPAWRGSITCQIQHVVTVLVACTAIEHNQTITANMVGVKRCAVDAGHGVPLSNLDEVIGLRATRALPAGSPLLSDAVEIIPLVKSNALVQVQAHCGAFLITTQAIACEDGHTNEVIHLRNVDTHQVFTARVTGPNTLEVVP